MTKDAPSSLIHIAIVGHVDHGKSTFVGRLFYETGSLPEGRYEEMVEICRKRGMPFEWAFLTDALQAERDQGITIDTAQIWLRTKKRSYAILDAPGHREFLKNMVTGAARADAAVLVIDAVERLREQSRRHAYLLHLLGVRQVIVAVNKMDQVDYDKKRFDLVEAEIRDFLDKVGIPVTHIVPLSAYEGEGVAKVGKALSWYKGPSILDAFDQLSPPLVVDDLPLRFSVQDVYKFDQRRIYAGRVESGQMSVGDEIVFSPGNHRSTIASIESWGDSQPPTTVKAGQSTGITLEDQLFIERGQVGAHHDRLPYQSNVFRARLFWLGSNPLEYGRPYDLRINAAKHQVYLEKIERVISTQDLSSHEADKIICNDVAEVVFRTRSLSAIDSFSDLAATGRFVISDDHVIAGGGIIDMEGYPDQRHQPIKSDNITAVDHRVTAAARAAKNGHRPGILWLTGLSGSGKSTIAVELERRLFEQGHQVFVLDGDNLRYGLNADLGFSPDDRRENIRRAGEIAALLSDAGFIVIAAFISPYREDRRRVREVRSEMFHEIWLQTSLETCEKRDPKGLYKKARSGEIPMFSGISAPYEDPTNPQMTLDTTEQSLSQSVEILMDYVVDKFGSGPRHKRSKSTLLDIDGSKRYKGR